MAKASRTSAQNVASVRQALRDRERPRRSTTATTSFCAARCSRKLRVLRHRLFEANFFIQLPSHRPHPLCHTLDKRKAHYGKTNEWTDYVSVNGGGNCSVASARDAMGIQWMTKKEINEAIPPAYTRWIGSQLIREL